MSSINHLPDEILSNILARLPVRDLVRYICVCKAWCSLITHQNFISAHFTFQKKSNGYLLHHKRDSGRNFFSIRNAKTYVEHSSFENPFGSEISFFKFAGSFNGLICLTDYYSFGETIYLWNPCIWKLKILRRSCFSRHFKDVNIFFAIGLGFDKHANDLKIVRIMYCGKIYMPAGYVEKEPPKVEVYSLATNSWRRIGTNAGYYTNDKLSTAYVNGAVHWAASKTGKGHTYGDFVLSFDFGSEKFGEIMLPKYHDDLDVDDSEVSLVVLRESLALIIYCFDNFLIKSCYIWVMRDYGKAESWTKEFLVIPDERYFRSFGIVNDNDFLMEATFCDGEIVPYDLEKLQFKGVAFGQHEDNQDVVNFAESLVLYNEGFHLTPRKNLIVEGGIHLGKRKRSVFLQLQKKWH